MMKRYAYIFIVAIFFTLLGANESFAGPVCQNFWDCWQFSWIGLIFQAAIVLPAIGAFGLLFISKKSTVVKKVSFCFVLLGLVVWGIIIVGSIFLHFNGYKNRQEKKIKIGQLDFKVFTPNVSHSKYEIDGWQLKSWYDGESYVRGEILNKRILSKGSEFKYPWGRLTQQKKTVDSLFPKKCPGTLFYAPKNFEHKCQLVGNTKDGVAIYETSPGDEIKWWKKPFFSAVKDETLIVVELGFVLENEDYAQVLEFFNHLGPIDSDQLRENYK